MARVPLWMRRVSLSRLRFQSLVLAHSALVIWAGVCRRLRGANPPAADLARKRAFATLQQAFFILGCIVHYALRVCVIQYHRSAEEARSSAVQVVPNESDVRVVRTAARPNTRRSESAGLCAVVVPWPRQQLLLLIEYLVHSFKPAN